jgi:sulfite reductase (ferredoxin)
MGVEDVKRASRQLRGSIAEELSNGDARFGEETVQVLKFHGVYQQDDRDLRKQARARGLDRHYQMMVRTRIPGGRVSPEGYLAHDDIAERWGNGTLRVTTRQDFQLHGVLKADLHASIKAINEALLTTLGGCGDQVRNVMCCPAPFGDGLRAEVLETLGGLVPALTPTTGAYHEIWIDGERVTGREAEDPPDELYGEAYLPRKFKVGVAIEGDNCIDVYTNDLGLIAVPGADGRLAGFNVVVGGGLGRTHNKPETYPAVAQPLAFVEPRQAVELARAVVKAQRDHGDRTNRRHARLKYLVAERGVAWFRAEVQDRVSFPLRAPRSLRRSPAEDHLGWHEQAGGRLFYGLFVENGRIQDAGSVRLRTALRRIVQRFRPTIWLTAQQNLLLGDLDPAARGPIELALRAHGVERSEEVPPARRHSMACPAIPTCGLAVAESERALPALIRQVDQLVHELGLDGERISYRMTGCPNGCARPYLGDVGFVGTTLGKYDVYLGGDFDGTRLNTLYASNVPLTELVATLRAPLATFAEEREEGETFGDWCHRLGVDNLRSRLVVADDPEERSA